MFLSICSRAYVRGLTGVSVDTHVYGRGCLLGQTYGQTYAWPFPWPFGYSPGHVLGHLIGHSIGHWLGARSPFTRLLSETSTWFVFLLTTSMSDSPASQSKSTTDHTVGSCRTPQGRLIINGKAVPTGPRAHRVGTMDDPFVTPPRGIETSSLSAARQSAAMVGRDQQVHVTPTPAGFTPRADRLAEAVSADNAQALLPPQACIFIAK